jgi:hypothetical protein
MKFIHPHATQIRYAITHIGSDGLRSLALANQGRNHCATREEAEEKLRQILNPATNSKSTLESVYGDLSKMRVDAVECYGHGDACGSIIGEE